MKLNQFQKTIEQYKDFEGNIVFNDILFSNAKLKIHIIEYNSPNLDNTFVINIYKNNYSVASFSIEYYREYHFESFIGNKGTLFLTIINDFLLN